MQSVFNFIIQPYENKRYNNIKDVDGGELITNTQIFTHQNVNRIGIVKCLPIESNTAIEIGDQVIVHHNVFRRFHDIRGNEQNSKSYLSEGNYLCGEDQVFAYKKNNKWIPIKGYCFIKPIESNNIFSLNKEKPLVGILKYKDPDLKNINEEDLVGFTPTSEYEFVIEKERLYRVKSKNITVKYEHQGDEKEYNPSWA